MTCSAVAVAACGANADRPAQKTETKVAWRTVGSWSGRGNRQTESFTSESGALRVRWFEDHAAPSAVKKSSFVVFY